MEAAKRSGEWSERSEHWIEQAEKLASARRLRQRRSEPLILTGNGVALRIDRGTLVITDGFTHPDQERKQYRFFRGDLALPPRIMLLDCSGSVSIDVLDWLAGQGVALINVDWRGTAVSIMASNGYAADTKKLTWQIETRRDHDRRMAFSNALIARKVAASLPTLKSAFPPSRHRDDAIAQCDAAISTLRQEPPSDMTSLRATEAICARAYFKPWNGLPMEWKGTARFPIPDDWHIYKGRGSLLNGGKNCKQNASHPLNAILNYAYGILQNRLQIKAVADGYDPTLGIMHHGRRGAPAYIFDVMEPERPRMDKLILAFVSGQRFSGADFPIREDGVCRLSPQLARTVTALVSAL